MVNINDQQKKKKIWLVITSVGVLFVLWGAWKCGEISSLARRDYQTYTSDGKTYAVIVDLDDEVISQRAEIQGNVLNIAVNEYTYHSKEGKSFTYTKYSEIGFITEPEEEPVILYPSK